MNYKNILYLKEKDYISTIKYIEKEEQIYSIKSKINKIAKKFLFDVNYYKKMIRKELELKNKIPIYFSEKLLLFTLNYKKEIYFINFYNILKITYEDKNVIIIFINYETLVFPLSKRILQNELIKIKKVSNYVENL